MNQKIKKQITSHLIEFFFIGLVMGVAEDMIAIYLATDTKITYHTFIVAFLVALPFAIISELIVDLKMFRKMFFKK